MMKKVLIFAIFSLLLITCAKDIVVEPPTSLRGFYVGRYFVINNISGATQTKEDIVHWTFTDQQFYAVFPSVSERVFCDFSGSYTLESFLNLDTTQIGAQICTVDDVADGVFTVRWVRSDEMNDSLILEHFDTFKDQKKIVKLEEQPEEE